MSLFFSGQCMEIRGLPGFPEPDSVCWAYGTSCSPPHSGQQNRTDCFCLMSLLWPIVTHGKNACWIDTLPPPGRSPNREGRVNANDYPLVRLTADCSPGYAGEMAKELCMVTIRNG